MIVLIAVLSPFAYLAIGLLAVVVTSVRSGSWAKADVWAPLFIWPVMVLVGVIFGIVIGPAKVVKWYVACAVKLSHFISTRTKKPVLESADDG